MKLKGRYIEGLGKLKGGSRGHVTKIHFRHA